MMGKRSNLSEASQRICNPNYVKKTMSKTVLLSSFATWEPHQRSNSSDDLLLEVLKANLYPPLHSPSLHFLRQLPVDFELAPQQAIAQVNLLQPDIVICCGMAEHRTKLTVESRAVTHSETLYTRVNLDRLIAGLTMTEISHDAGQFVCNWLYQAMLKHLQSSERLCLFVHVPILTPKNSSAIESDFCRLIERMLEQ
jgi:pyroglutamyl-peptidase